MASPLTLKDYPRAVSTDKTTPLAKVENNVREWAREVTTAIRSLHSNVSDLDTKTTKNIAKVAASIPTTITSTTIISSSGTATAASSNGSSSFDVTQVGHGFSVGQVVRSSGAPGEYTLAQADSPANAEVVGYVSAVKDSNNFTVTIDGKVTAGVPAGAPGSVFYLSPDTAGALTLTEPSFLGQVSKPLLIIDTSGVAGIFINFRGAVISDGSDGGAPPSDSNVITITQAAHGFSVGQVVRSSGVAGQFALAQADSAANAEVVGYVATITDANTFTLALNGQVTTGVPTAAAGSVFYLSPTTPGAIVTTEPSAIGQVSKPMMIIIASGLEGVFINFRGSLISDGGESGAPTPETSADLDDIAVIFRSGIETGLTIQSIAALIQSFTGLTRISTPTSFFVDTGGDDSDGLSLGTAFTTISLALNRIIATYIIDADVTINISDGTWTQFLTLTPWIGHANITINGNPSDVTAVVLTHPPSFQRRPGGKWIVQNITFSSTTYGIQLSLGSIVEVKDCSFAASRVFDLTDHCLLVMSGHIHVKHPTLEWLVNVRMDSVLSDDSAPTQFVFDNDVAGSDAFFKATGVSRIALTDTSIDLGGFTITGSKFNIEDASILVLSGTLPGDAAGFQTAACHVEDSSGLIT